MTRTGDTLWYFAYGSNLALSTLVGRRGLTPLESHAAWVDDWALRFDLPVGPGERAVANLAAAPGARTWGVAYRITTADAARLDRTEGVDRGYYVRVTIAASRPTATDPLAAYTYQSPHGIAGRKPSARYLGIILEGARHHALPDHWIAHLEGFELAIDERLARGKP